MDKDKMKKFLFILTSGCIFIAVFICVLAIWEYVEPDVAWKTIATVGVILVGAMAFNATNEQIGKKAPKSQ